MKRFDWICGDFLAGLLLAPLILFAASCSPAASSAALPPPEPIPDRVSDRAPDTASEEEPEAEAMPAESPREEEGQDGLPAPPEEAEKVEEPEADEAKDQETATAASEEAIEPADPEAPPGWEKTFRVRMGVVGRGFADGDHGLLRIDDGGLSFTPWNQGGRPWTIPWKNLREAVRDVGLWEARETIAVVEVGDGKRYLVRTASSGGFLSAEPILSAVREGRNRQDSKN